ncbi:hypothetical protein AeRB84_011864 [Aphanomyces euteiches]|nr:hypothetical protein AeRB84_011864 [Aphanomyces euteiches]
MREIDVTECLNECMADAIQLTLGLDYVEQYAVSRNRVSASRGSQSGADLQVFFANQVFKQHIRTLCDASFPKDTPLRTTVTSSFGLIHEKEYATSEALAAALVDHLTELSQIQTLVADIRHDARGMIKLTTKAHLEWHTIMGRLPCSLCGLFFNGPKGLRVHREIQHQLAYADAKLDVVTTQQQLIVYTAPASDLRLWKQTAEATKRQRRALEPGLDAARRGDLAAMQLLVAQGWNPNDARDIHGNDAMLWAAIEGHVEVCKYLHATHNMNVSALQGKLGRNTLHWTARNGHRELCEWLIHDLKMDVDSPTHDGTTPLHYAVYGEQHEMVRWLVYIVVTVNRLADECNRGECGSDIHRLNTFGCNASQWCAMTGNVAILKYLVDQGLDCAILNRNGHSALHKAAIKGHIEICEWLITPRALGGGGLGLRHMQLDDEGFTPTTFASANGHMRLSEILQAKHDELLHEPTNDPPSE